MATKKVPAPKKPDLDALKKIQIGLEELPDQFQNAFSPWRQLFFNYLKGIAGGLGAITALAIVIPLMLWLLRSFQWVPLAGKVVTEIVNQVEDARKR